MKENNNYRFIISLYGNRYRGMLITLLYSIKKSNTNALVTVLWQDIDLLYKERIIKTFPFVEYVDTNFDFSSDPIQRISSKTKVWNFAAQKFSGERLCFLDVDTLVFKDIQYLFQKEVDVIFTSKEEKFPLNTGVMLAQGLKAKLFFEKWYTETISILKNKSLLRESTNPNYPYGGADQMSLYKMIDFKKEKKTYQIDIKQERIVLSSLPCKILNETRSVAISNETHIVHLKGGWQPILLEGKGFTRNRPRRASWNIYISYLCFAREALDMLNSANNTTHKLSFWGIIVPSYINLDTLHVNYKKYFLFVLKDLGITFLKLITKIIKRI